MTLTDAKNKAFKEITGLSSDFIAINSEQEKIQDRAAELIWNAACDELLASISKGFKDNSHKASYSDQVVFTAISETITNFPKPNFIK